MPANLSPDYLAAERDYRAARSNSEKVGALERMLATIPKHKGTEKLQADLKRRLSQARRETHKKGEAHSTPFYLVRREGAGQVALLGPPNSGKSQLLAALTHAHPEVAEYPFTTRAPLPGMMRYENVQIQLVDLPPLSSEFTEPWLGQVVRNANASVLVVDPGDIDVLDGIEYALESLAGWRSPEPRLLVATKADLPGAGANYRALEELYGGRWASLHVSAVTGQNLDRFRHAVFELLNVVRVYTKIPGHKPELNAPYVIPRGETVADAARMVHKDFAENLKFARLFRKDALDRGGMMVERTHVVEDEDILEYHI